MKILIVTQKVDQNDSVLGFFHKWIDEFSLRCDKVTVICLQAGKYNFSQNVKVLSLGKEKGGSRLVYIFRFYHYIWRERGNYDCVFIHMNPEYILLGGFLWLFLKKRVGLWYAHKSTPWYLRLSIPLVKVIFTPSKESFRLSSPKLQIVGHGIDTERKLPQRVPPQGILRLMTSGRVSQSKQLEVLIDAYLVLKKSGGSITLTVFGSPVTANDNIYIKKLKERLLQAGENPDNILIGSVPHSELPGRRANMDYFLHASQTGSLDKAVLDAIISGVIPISSSEAYRDLFTGLEKYLSYTDGDSDMLAQRIRVLEKLGTLERDNMKHILKERVLREHSLQSLILKIVYILQHA